nr:hypothetical protein CFP56_44299 [Quercus suber]
MDSSTGLLESLTSESCVDRASLNHYESCSLTACRMLLVAAFHTLMSLFEAVQAVTETLLACRIDSNRSTLTDL